VIGGLGCLAVGGAILWSLGFLNNQAGRSAQRRKDAENADTSNLNALNEESFLP
jgi:hypothetical protein